MKVTYYLPAHASYFKGNTYTQEEVDQAVSLFQFLIKPGKLGEIPEAFVFLKQPGKSVAPKFDSTEMKSPDTATEERWLKHTMEFAWSQLNRHVQQITEFLEDGRNPKKKTPP